MLPTITHLQYAVLTLLLSGERAGQAIRDKLAAEGECRSGPAFYQFMAGLENKRFARGRYETKIIEGQIFRTRHYTITARGRAVCREVLEFYKRW